MNWQIWASLAMVLIIADVFAINSTVIIWFGIGAAFAAVAAAIGVGNADTGWMWQLGVFAMNRCLWGCGNGMKKNIRAPHMTIPT